MSEKRELIDILKNIDEETIKNQFESMNKKEVEKEAIQTIKKMNEEDFKKAVKKFGTEEYFLHYVMRYLIIKSYLIKIGFQVSLAAGAASLVCFDVSQIAYAVAGITGIEALENVGIDLENLSDIGFTVYNAASDFVESQTSIVDDLFSLITQ